jgi:SPP1 family predicted phage head-tail adaptor
MPHQRGEMNSLGINPGQMRHLITLLEPSTITGAAGAVTTYSPGIPPVQFYAKIECAGNEEVIRAGQDVTKSHIKVTARYNVLISSQKHIETPSGARYVIQTVEDLLEMRAYMELICEGVGVGA